MLIVKLEETELFDSEKNEFITIPETILRLEHSLISLSKWESIWEIPFLDAKEKTNEQFRSYVRCMMLDEMPDNALLSLSAEHYKMISDYIGAKKTATTFSQRHQPRGSGEFITSELIYYWLVALTIPFHPVETWHLNRTLTLIRIASIKNTPPKKMSKSEMMSRQRQLNAARRAKTGSLG